MSEEDFHKHFVMLTDVVESRFFGIYRGIVTDIEKEDRKRMGVITVKIPEIFIDCTIPLVKPSVPFAGERCGFFAFPKIGDGIMVMFQGGDPSRPIHTGFWWADDQIPEPISLDTVGLVSRTGHRVILDDKNESISLVHAKGAEISLTEDEITFKIGRTKMVISSKGVNVNNGRFVVKT
jgi:hypothetical protein